MRHSRTTLTWYLDEALDFLSEGRFQILILPTTVVRKLLCCMRGCLRLCMAVYLRVTVEIMILLIRHMRI